MPRRAWPASWPTNTVGSGGLFEEREAVQAELLETLQAGPGEAARREVAVGESGPGPSRWTLRTIRVSVEWLTEYTLSGVWRVLQACGLGVHASWARLFSPDPDYHRKVRRLHRCLRAAARHPDTVVALFLDEFGYQRWPEVAPTWGLEAAVAQRAGNNQQWRTIGALNALTGQVNYLDGYIVGRQQVSAFYAQLDRAYPAADLLYVIQDNWNIHTHPDVLTALACYPRITPVWLPTYAPWLNPIEKLWRWLRQDVLKMHRWVEDWPQVKQRVPDFLDQFAYGSPDLLRYVGLIGKGKLAAVLNTS
ncbi:MAG: IS630 family transposase [Actinobacteria bacterium]|nr:IS630 family transposase [Actinomycetota bacterium]